MALLNKNEFISWVAETDFSEGKLLAKILAIDITEGPKGNDYTLVFTSNDDILKMSVYGANMRTLIGKYGMDTSTWIGKNFVLFNQMIGTKKRKIIAV